MSTTQSWINRAKIHLSLAETMLNQGDPLAAERCITKAQDRLDEARNSIVTTEAVSS